MFESNQQSLLWGAFTYSLTFVLVLLGYTLWQVGRRDSNFLRAESFARLLFPELLLFITALLGGTTISWFASLLGDSGQTKVVLYLIMALLFLTAHFLCMRWAHKKTRARRRQAEVAAVTS